MCPLLSSVSLPYFSSHLLSSLPYSPILSHTLPPLSEPVIEKVVSPFYPKIRALVIGGSGALGRSFLPVLKELSPTSILTTIDYDPFPTDVSLSSSFTDTAKDAAKDSTEDTTSIPTGKFTHHHVMLEKGTKMAAIPSTLIPKLNALDELDKYNHYNLIINAAGTWAGGAIPSPKKADAGSVDADVEAFTDYLLGFDTNIPANLNSTALATALSGRYMPKIGTKIPGEPVGDEGMLVLTGAAASTTNELAKGSGAGMAGYVTSKFAGTGLAKVTLEELSKRNRKIRVTVVHPVTLDTPMNRKFLTFDESWTHPDALAAGIISLYFENEADRADGRKGRIQEYIVRSHEDGETGFEEFESK